MGSNLMGVDAFLKVMGTWDETDQEYAVEGYRWVMYVHPPNIEYSVDSAALTTV